MTDKESAVYLDKDGVFHADRKKYEQERLEYARRLRREGAPIQDAVLKIKYLREDIKEQQRRIEELKRTHKRKIAEYYTPLSTYEWEKYIAETEKGLREFAEKVKKMREAEQEVR